MEYCRPWTKAWFMDWLLSSEQYHIRRFVKALRSEEYYQSIRPDKLKLYWWKRRKNKLGVKVGAGAVVVKTIPTSGVTVTGIPGKEVAK